MMWLLIVCGMAVGAFAGVGVYLLFFDRDESESV